MDDFPFLRIGVEEDLVTIAVLARRLSWDGMGFEDSDRETSLFFGETEGEVFLMGVTVDEVVDSGKYSNCACFSLSCEGGREDYVIRLEWVCNLGHNASDDTQASYHILSIMSVRSNLNPLSVLLTMGPFCR